MELNQTLFFFLLVTQAEVSVKINHPINISPSRSAIRAAAADQRDHMLLCLYHSSAAKLPSSGLSGLHLQLVNRSLFHLVFVPFLMHVSSEKHVFDLVKSVCVFVCVCLPLSVTVVIEKQRPKQI